MTPSDPPERPVGLVPAIRLPRSTAATTRKSKRRPKPRPRSRYGQFGIGLGFCALGAVVLASLVMLAARLDALLLLSMAISNLIGGLSRLVLALLQAVGLVLLLAVALAGLLCLMAGLMRIGKALWPQGHDTDQPLKRSNQ